MGWELITPDSLAELDSSQNTKLSGVAANATVGATVGTNFFKTGTTTNYGVGEFENAQLAFSVSNNSLTLGRGSASNVVLSGLGQGLVGLSGVTNSADQTSANTSANTSNVGNQTVANAQTAVARANAGLNSSGDVARTVSTSFGGTGHGTNTTAFENGAMSISTSNNSITLGRGAYSGTSITGLGQALVNLSGVSNNADVTSANTANNTSNVGNQTVANAQSAVARANAGLTSTGDVARTVPSNRYTNTTYTDLSQINTAQSNKLGGIATGANNYSLPSTVMIGTPSISGTTLTLPRNGAASIQLTTQDTNTHPTANETRGHFSGSGGTAFNSATGVFSTDSTSTIRQGVTTFTTNKSQSIVWTNISGQMSPSSNVYDVTVTFKNGEGTTIQTTTIRLTRTSTALGDATVQSGSSAGVTTGTAKSAGSLQTTTVTKNSITCTITGLIIDGSGWNFK